MTEKLKIEIEVDSKTGEARIKGFGKAGEAAGKQVGAGMAGADAKSKSLGKSLLALGGAVGGIMLIKKAFSALSGQVAESVGLANKQEAAEKDLEATLRATGNACGYNLDQLKSMAVGMQGVTKVGDEVTLSGMAILSTFKKVRGEGFERATMAALDMSQIMKQDLKSSMTMIGKAVNDPIQGISALTRVGVTFTDQQKDQIKILQESGDVTAAQNIILAELESQFGGAAAAAREDFGGSITAAGNALGDMKEQAGFVITKSQFLIEIAHMAEKQFMAWGKQIEDNREYLQELVKDGVLWVVDAIATSIDIMGFFHMSWLELRRVANIALEGIAWLLEKDIEVLRLFLKPLDMIFAALVKMGKMDVNPFDSMEKGIKTFRESSADVTENIEDDMARTMDGYNAVKDTIQGVRRKIEEIPISHREVAGSSKQTAIAVISDQEDITAATAESMKQQIALTDDFNKTYEKFKKSELVVTQDSLKAQADAYTAAGADKIKVAEWLTGELGKLSDAEVKKAEETAKKITEESVKVAEARKDAYRDMYKDLDLQDDNYFQQQYNALAAQKLEYIQILKDQKETHKLTLEDQAIIDAWYANEVEKVWKRQVLASDDFFSGLLVGFDDVLDKERTWAETGYDMVKTFTDKSKSAISDNLMSAIKGDFDSLRSAWKGLLDSMLRILTDKIAAMITAWTTSGIINLLSGGGISGFSLANLGAGAATTAAGSAASTAAGTAAGSAATTAAGTISGAALSSYGLSMSANVGTGGGVIDIGGGVGYDIASGQPISLSPTPAEGLTAGQALIYAGAAIQGYHALQSFMHQEWGGGLLQAGSAAALLTGNPLLAAGLTIADLLGVGGILGGGEPTFRFSGELEEFFPKKWAKGSGLGFADETSMTSEGWYNDIVSYYTNLRNAVTEEYNAYMAGLISIMDTAYPGAGKALEEQLVASAIDFVPRGRWDYSDAETGIAEGVKQYRDYLLGFTKTTMYRTQQMLMAPEFGEGVIAGHYDWSNMWKPPEGNDWTSLVEWRQHGGSVFSQHPYIVGERGPEVFVPSTSGNIVPNDALGGTREMVLNITVEVGGEEFDARIMRVADNVRVKAERRNMGTNRMYS